LQATANCRKAEHLRERIAISGAPTSIAVSMSSPIDSASFAVFAQMSRAKTVW
jgi:hypothetical protein